MTLLPAASAGGDAIPAPDRRIRFGPAGKPYQPGEEDKLFLVGGCAVASHGTSPRGADVPALIRSFEGYSGICTASPPRWTNESRRCTTGEHLAPSFSAA